MNKFVVLAVIVAILAFYLIRSNANKEAAKINIAAGFEFYKQIKRQQMLLKQTQVCNIKY